MLVIFLESFIITLKLEIPLIHSNDFNIESFHKRMKQVILHLKDGMDQWPSCESCKKKNKVLKYTCGTRWLIYRSTTTQNDLKQKHMQYKGASVHVQLFYTYNIVTILFSFHVIIVGWSGNLLPLEKTSHHVLKHVPCVFVDPMLWRHTLFQIRAIWLHEGMIGRNK